MMTNWHQCKKILCIRPDNMGDLLMSSPAIRALKQSFDCQICVLTSTVAGGIASFIPEIDEIITFDFPWVKNNALFDQTAFSLLIDTLRLKNFDAAVVFTVYSQNPLPSAIVAFMAGIPLRLGYCRENPYSLLTNWVPDEEPYTYIRHQVQRDLDLVSSVGALTSNEQLSLTVNADRWESVRKKLAAKGVDLTRPWLIFHPGVSEEKRKFPEQQWTALATKVTGHLSHQVLITGGPAEFVLAERIAANSGMNTYNLAGIFSLDELILLVKKSPLLISVNTGTIHIAAATNTPVIVLYALTNPQHSPWLAIGKVFPFPVAKQLQSKNEVIRYVIAHLDEKIERIDVDEVINVAGDLLHGINIARYSIPELFGVTMHHEQVL